MKDYDAINPFGPMVYRTDLTEDFHNFLLEGLEETKNGEDQRNLLVGNIGYRKEA